MKCKVRPFIMGHPLFTFYSCLYVFSFRLFSNISKTVFGPSLIWFCREFQALSFDNKKGFNHTDNRRDIFKILRGPFFLGHPLGSDAIFNDKNVYLRLKKEKIWTESTLTRKVPDMINAD